MRSLFFDDRCFHGRHRCRSLGPYYSARTAGTPSSRVRTEISVTVWMGMLAIVIYGQRKARKCIRTCLLVYSYCVLSIFGCFSAETVKIVKNSQNKDWTGQDVIMYMLLLILLCPKQWAQKFPYLVCESWRINVTEIVWLLQVRRR